MWRTEHEFTLPKGYVDSDGTVHRSGLMRLATAADEILPLRDPRVTGNPAYLFVLLLSRVVIRLGPLANVDPKVIESLFAEDFSYLQKFYSKINGGEPEQYLAQCPKCEHRFDYEPLPSGEL